MTMTEQEFFASGINFNKYSHSQLEKMIGAGSGTIRYWFRKRGIKKHPSSPGVKKISKNGEVEKLVEEGYSSKQIGKTLGFTTRQITVYRDKNKLDGSKFDKIELTPEEEQVVIGSLLGDGCVTRNLKREGYFQLCIQHSVKQKDYVQYKAELLKTLSKGATERFKADKRPKFKGGFHSIELKTRPHPLFEEFRNRWYKDKKFVCKEDFEKLQPLGLSIWFMDDGSKASNTVSFATLCFSQEEVNWMALKLKEKWNLHFHTAGRILTLSAVDYDKFYELVDSYIIPSMRYKLPEYKRINKRIRPVIQKDLDGNFIKHWPSATAPTKPMGLKSRSAIFNAAKRGQKIKGFLWEFENPQSLLTWRKKQTGMLPLT